jgi:hypothetical protein
MLAQHCRADGLPGKIARSGGPEMEKPLAQEGSPRRGGRRSDDRPPDLLSAAR